MLMCAGLAVTRMGDMASTKREIFRQRIRTWRQCQNMRGKQGLIADLVYRTAPLCPATDSTGLPNKTIQSGTLGHSELARREFAFAMQFQ